MLSTDTSGGFSVSFNLKILEAVRNDLHDFSAPENGQGFLPIFYEWVIKEWRNRPYYQTELVNFGYDLSNYPQRTDFLLREKARSYRDFIHANNGHQYATLLSGHRDSCETMEKNLYEYFHEAMRLRALTFLGGYCPEIDAEDLWNRIFCEDFEERGELLMAEDISVHFGFYGLAVEPYMCQGHDPKNSMPDRFSQWEPEDFEAQLAFLRALPKPEIPRPAPLFSGLRSHYQSTMHRHA